MVLFHIAAFHPAMNGIHKLNGSSDANRARRCWDEVEREEVDSGEREGITTSERERVKALERENKELRRANVIAATASRLACGLRAFP